MTKPFIVTANFASRFDIEKRLCSAQISNKTMEFVFSTKLLQDIHENAVEFILVNKIMIRLEQVVSKVA